MLSFTWSTSELLLLCIDVFSFGVTFVLLEVLLLCLLLVLCFLQAIPFPTRWTMDLAVLNAVSATTTAQAANKNSRTCKCSEVSMSAGAILHAIDNDFVSKSSVSGGGALALVDWFMLLRGLPMECGAMREKDGKVDCVAQG